MRPPKGMIRRVREVVDTFLFEGVQIPLGRVRLTHCASWRCRIHCTLRRWMGRAPSAKPWPVAVKAALIRLGPAFVKMGQILSVRSDLAPPELVKALHGLQEDVPAEPFENIRPFLEEALGQPVEKFFTSFNPEPLAAGSVAQVYRATMTGGQEVAVKVKRPDIQRKVELDLGILVWLAEQSEKHLKEAQPYRLASAARELQRYTLLELDFRHEAAITIRLREALKDRQQIRIPQVYHHTCDVIVMEFIPSFPLDDLAQLEAAGVDRRQVAHDGVEAVLAQIFDVGVFHADPHPGNLRCNEKGELVFLDFGIYGTLNDRLLREGGMLMWLLSKGEVDLASYFLLRMATLEPGADVAGFRRAIEERYNAWLGSSVKEYGFAKLIYEEFTLGVHHGVVLPPDVVLLSKAMVTVEGVVLAICPEMDLMKEAAPFLEKWRQRAFSPKRLEEALEKSLPVWWNVLEDLPVNLAMKWDQLGQGTAPTPIPPQAAPTMALTGPAMLLSGAVLVAGAHGGAAPQITGWILLALGIGLILKKERGNP